MIESSRRHGYFDARWNTNTVRPPRALVPASDERGHSVQRWENEGGRYTTTTQTDAPAGLEWYAFSNRYFPGQGRHHLEALEAYEAYRSAATPPGPVPRFSSSLPAKIVAAMSFDSSR
jgi:hypothetical protein